MSNNEKSHKTVKDYRLSVSELGEKKMIVGFESGADREINIKSAEHLMALYMVFNGSKRVYCVNYNIGAMTFIGSRIPVGDRNPDGESDLSILEEIEACFGD